MASSSQFVIEAILASYFTGKPMRQMSNGNESRDLSVVAVINTLLNEKPSRKAVPYPKKPKNASDCTVIFRKLWWFDCFHLLCFLSFVKVAHCIFRYYTPVLKSPWSTAIGSKKPLAISGHRKTGPGTSPSFLWQQSSIVYGLFPATFLKTREATFWFPRPTFGPSSVRPWYSEAWESPLEAPSVDPRLLEGVCPRGPILGSPSKGEKMWFLFGVRLIITYQKKSINQGIHGDSCWSIYIYI